MKHLSILFFGMIATAAGMLAGTITAAARQGAAAQQNAAAQQQCAAAQQSTAARQNAAAQPLTVQGTVFLDKNADGTKGAKEKGIAQVAVSDGFTVVLTDRQGRYSIDLNPKARFVTVYTPSGYRNTNRFFTDVRALVSGSGDKATYPTLHRGNNSFDFGLAKTQVYGSFAHMSDIEERYYDDWIDRLKDYSAANGHDFIAITGDICYSDGLILMSKFINDETMQKRVVYTIGNHDLIKGNEDWLGNPYGEKNYEDCFGPSWYAFSVNGMNFIVTPMMAGDAKPSYTYDDITNWIKAYLAVLPEGAPLTLFNHDANTRLIPEGANTKAFVYGHRHTQYRTTHDSDVQFFCTMSPGKGSNDHAPAALRQLEYDASGINSTRLRYGPLSNHVAAHIAPTEGTMRLTAVAYDVAADVTEVTATFPDGTKRSLSRQNDMMWQTAITEKAPAGYITVAANFSNGERAVSRIAAEPAIKWTNSIGSKPFFCTPILSDGHIYIATIDNEMCLDCGIYSLSAADGSREWFFRTDNSIHGDIALCDGAIYACDTDYNVYAVNAADGTLKWKTHLATTFYPSLTEGVLVEDGKVFAGTAGNLCALAAKDGSIIWKNTHSHSTITNVGTSRATAGALLTNGYWVGRFCYDQETGGFLWENKEYQHRYSSCTPAVVDTTFIYAGYSTLMQVGARGGEVLRSQDFPTIFNIKSEPLVADGKLFIGTSHDGFLAVNLDDFSTAWTFETKAPLILTSPYTKGGEKTVECSPAAYKDKVIFGANDGYVYCRSQESGKESWRVNIGLPVLGKPVIDGDNMIIIDFAGNVLCYDLTVLERTRDM